MTLGQILIVDDDHDFVAAYREILQGQGLTVTASHTPDDAKAVLAHRGHELDVVLLDQKLQGPGGGDTGLKLIEDVQRLAPFAKTIVVTGYASPGAIERAFELGVYDYLVKNGAFEALLRAKVRNAVEATTARRLVGLSAARLEHAVAEAWALVGTETDRNRKGVALERLVELLFRTTPGIERTQTRLDNETEEIDIVVENRSDDPLWRQLGAPYLLGECKNWSKPCGSGEFRSFYVKLTTKYGNAKIGFFIAPGGFTSEFHNARARHELGSALVIPVGAEDLARWVAGPDRLAILNELHRRAALGA